MSKTPIIVFGQTRYVEDILESSEYLAQEQYKRYKEVYAEINRLFKSENRAKERINLLHKLSDVQRDIVRMESNPETPSRNRALDALTQLEDYYTQELKKLEDNEEAQD